MSEKRVGEGKSAKEPRRHNKPNGTSKTSNKSQYFQRIPTTLMESLFRIPLVTHVNFSTSTHKNRKCPPYLGCQRRGIPHGLKNLV
jgi:hypothetical protein